MADKSGGGNGDSGGSSAGKSSSSESGSLFSGQQPDLSGATGKGGSYSGDRPMLDPDAELSRLQKVTSKDITRQLGAATQMAQLMSRIGGSAAAAENQRYSDNLARQNQRNWDNNTLARLTPGMTPSRTFTAKSGGGSSSGYSRDPIEMARQMAGVNFMNKAREMRLDDYYQGLSDNRNFHNQLQLQSPQLRSQENIAGLQSQAQLGAARLGLQGQLGSSAMGMMGSLFGSVSAGSPSGRYW